MKIRLCVIGGGSVNWMRGLMRDVYTLKGVEGGEIRLVDPNTEHVTSVKNMLLKFNEITDKNFEVSFVEDRILSQRPLRYDNTLAYLIPGMLAHFDYGDLM